MKIIEYNPKTGVSTTRVVPPCEAEKLRKQFSGKFAEDDSEPMFLRRFRELLAQKSRQS